MKPVVDACCICLRFDVKYYQLNDAIRPPIDLTFEGCAEFHGVIEKILKLEREVKKLTRVICQRCHEEFYRMYCFIHRCAKSDRILSQLKEVNIRLEKLPTIPEVVNIKQETGEIFGNDIRHEGSTSECISMFEIVQAEFDDSVQGVDDVKDFNTDLPRMEYFDTVKPNVSEVNMDPIDGQRLVEISQHFKTEELGINEEWITTERETIETEVNETSLEDHTRINHERKLYEYEQCHTLYKNLGTLESDKQTDAGELFKCCYCSLEFPSQICLEVHERQKHSETTKTEIKKSISRKTKSNKILKCDVCQAEFENRHQLYKHKALHEGPLKCDQCDVEYRHKYSLQNHQLSQAGVSFKCKVCNEIFLTRCNLRQHLLATHWIRKYTCDQCDAKYSRRYSLIEHKIIKHSKSKELFQCDQCNATFTTRAGLRYHRQSHNGYKYECDQCDAKFRLKNRLNNHKISHNGLKCDQCHAPFPIKGVLMRHIEDSSTRKLTCDQCDDKLMKHERQLSSKISQCRNCQMLGESASHHSSETCNASDNILCGHCKGVHKATDSNCLSRMYYLQMRKTFSQRNSCPSHSANRITNNNNFNRSSSF